jgi:hypothetical protein
MAATFPPGFRMLDGLGGVSFTDWFASIQGILIMNYDEPGQEVAERVPEKATGVVWFSVTNRD